MLSFILGFATGLIIVGIVFAWIGKRLSDH